VKPAALLVAFAICLCAGSRVQAAGGNELEVAGRVGIGVTNQGGQHPWGPAGGVDVAYGINDAWAVSGTIQGSTASVSANKSAGIAAGSEHSAAALVGLTYTVDVLRLVPYVTAQFGVAELTGPLAPSEAMFASAVALGGDYFLTAQLKLGVMFQYLYRPQDLFSDPRNLGSSPFTFSTTVRLAWVF
jgi:hypothetical protein